MHQVRRQDPRAAKRRDIARSILPSSSRRGARKALARVRRADRRAVSSALRSLRNSAALSAGVSSSAAPLHCDPGGEMGRVEDHLDIQMPDYPTRDHHEAVLARRRYDKIAPIVAWARHETSDMDAVVARRHLRSLLPDGVIGWHAMSHLEVELDLDPRWSWFRLRLEADRMVEPHSLVYPTLLSLGEWALTRGHHAELNRRMGLHLADGQPSRDPIRARPWRHRRVLEVAPARPLLGIHDLDNWCAHHVAIVIHSGFKAGPPDLERWRHFQGLAPVVAWAHKKGWSGSRSIPDDES